MVRTVRTGPVIGMIAQLALLATLAATVGLSALGWAAGTGWGLVTNVALTRGLVRRGATVLGPADRVTLTRATLVGGVAALVATTFSRPAPLPLLLALTVVALVLDAVDGAVARHTATGSPLGARFDMEVDAFLIFVLSVSAAWSVGVWVLAIGAARYLSGVAGALVPWLREPVPPRYWRKVVAAIQGIVLAVVVAQILPRPVAVATLAVALALLGESFGRDVWWLWRQHRGAPLRVAMALRRAESGAEPGQGVS